MGGRLQRHLRLTGPCTCIPVSIATTVLSLSAAFLHQRCSHSHPAHLRAACRDVETPEGPAAQICSVYFESPGVAPVLFNSAVMKGLWGAVTLHARHFRDYLASGADAQAAAAAAGGAGGAAAAVAHAAAREQYVQGLAQKKKEQGGGGARLRRCAGPVAFVAAGYWLRGFVDDRCRARSKRA